MSDLVTDPGHVWRRRSRRLGHALWVGPSAGAIIGALALASGHATSSFGYGAKLPSPLLCFAWVAGVVSGLWVVFAWRVPATTARVQPGRDRVPVGPPIQRFERPVPVVEEPAVKS